MGLFYRVVTIDILDYPTLQTASRLDHGGHSDCQYKRASQVVAESVCHLIRWSKTVISRRRFKTENGEKSSCALIYPTLQAASRLDHGGLSYYQYKHASQIVAESVFHLMRWSKTVISRRRFKTNNAKETPMP